MASPKKKKCAQKKTLQDRLETIVTALEKSGWRDYIEYRSNIRRLLLHSFFGGLARGFGTAIGFTLLGALVIYLLQSIAFEKLPVIGKFIADIVKIVQEKL